MLAMKGSFWACGKIPAAAGAVHAADEPDTRTLSELRADLDSRKTTSVELVEAFTRRIEAIDRNGPQPRSVIAINPDAIKQARALEGCRPKVLAVLARYPGTFKATSSRLTRCRRPPARWR